MKVAIYLRVSTEEQTTLNQELTLIDYCKKNNHEIFKIYRDEGVSGISTSRKELDNLMTDMRNKMFDAVVVWKLDRLGRSLQHLLQLIQEFKNKSVKFISVTEGFDTTTPQGELFFSMAGAFAQYERSIIRERIKAGLERCKSEGKILGRPKGSNDKKKRKKGGYYLRYQNEQKRSL